MLKIRRILAVALAGVVASAAAARDHRVTWSEIVDFSVGDNGAATLRFDDGEFTVTGQYRGEIHAVDIDSPNPYFGPQYVETYTSPFLQNPPPDNTLIRLYGGGDRGGVIEFDQPVTNVVLAIVSLGAPSIDASFRFDRPGVLEATGPGFFGNGSLSLDEESRTVLAGREGHGLIRFSGPMQSLEWRTPQFETWYGFRVGVVLEDCDASGVLDAIQLLRGAIDENEDGILDCCEAPCVGDLNGDDTVGPPDLGILLAVWGTDGGKIGGADLNGDGTVNAADLGLLIGAWGDCGCR